MKKLFTSCKREGLTWVDAVILGAIVIASVCMLIILDFVLNIHSAPIHQL